MSGDLNGQGAGTAGAAAEGARETLSGIPSGMGAQGVATPEAAGAGNSPTPNGSQPTYHANPTSGHHASGADPNGPSVYQVPAWANGLSDELKGYIHQKGFKDPGSVVDSYRNMEKLLGVPQERIVKLPVKDDDPAWNEVYEKLGRPKSAKEYQIELPNDQTDSGFIDWAKNTFHELGISKMAGEKLVGRWNQYVSDQQKNLIEQHNEHLKKESESLHKEWGLAFDKYKSIAENAARTFGIDRETILKLEEGMGPAKTMKFLHAVGSRLSEAQFHSGNSNGTFSDVMPPDVARGKLQALRNDSDFVQRYANGDLRAINELENLNRMANPN